MLHSAFLEPIFPWMPSVQCSLLAASCDIHFSNVCMKPMMAMGADHEEDLSEMMTVAYRSDKQVDQMTVVGGPAQTSASAAHWPNAYPASFVHVCI